LLLGEQVLELAFVPTQADPALRLLSFHVPPLEDVAPLPAVDK